MLDYFAEVLIVVRAEMEASMLNVRSHSPPIRNDHIKLIPFTVLQNRAFQKVTPGGFALFSPFAT